MRNRWAPVLALALIGCDTQEAEYDRWCTEFAARTNILDFVNQDTGYLERRPDTNEIVYPGTARVVITRSEERCILREAQKAIDRAK